jgi:hypothetical protein
MYLCSHVLQYTSYNTPTLRNKYRACVCSCAYRQVFSSDILQCYCQNAVVIDGYLAQVEILHLHIKYHTPDLLGHINDSASLIPVYRRREPVQPQSKPLVIRQWLLLTYTHQVWMLTTELAGGFEEDVWFDSCVHHVPCRNTTVFILPRNIHQPIIIQWEKGGAYSVKERVQSEV